MLTESKKALVTVGIWDILKSVWFSVRNTLKLQHSWPWAVVSYTLLALLCPETDWNIRVGKQGYVSILTDFKYRKYTAKVGQDNVNIGVVTIFRLANTSLLQV